MGRFLGRLFSSFFGSILKSILALALVTTGGWGMWQYSNYRTAADQLAQRDAQVEMLEEEGDRHKRMLRHYGEIAAQREERKEAWQAEALKWKNRMATLLEENKDVKEWAGDTYPAELD